MTGPSYQGLRLDDPLAEFHRAVDLLRWDTIPAPRDRPPQPHCRRRDPADGQARLLEEAS